MTSPEPLNIVDLITDIFERRGTDSYLGESVTMSQHMLQAAYLAEQADAEDVVIAAALLHDIGHYTNEFPEEALEQGNDNFHEEAGARVLQQWFPQQLIDCVRYHVPAKRYLCTVRPSYYEELSEASRHSLALQGGPMSTAEASSFEKQPHLDDIVQVRIWDDLAKQPKIKTPSFSHYVPILRSVISMS